MTSSHESVVPGEALRTVEPASGLVASSSRRAQIAGCDPSSHRIVALEGMRGFAALLVFFVHFSALLGSYATPRYALPWITRYACGLGHTGVDVFFVISGFLMYGIVMRKPVPFSNYLWRRAKRIYPVFLFVLVIYIATLYATPGEVRIPHDRTAAVGFILANLAMLPGMFSITPVITVAWSLSYEWFYYLALPFTVWALSLRRWSPRKRIALMLTICAVQALLCVVHLSVHPRLILFGAGICLWELATNWEVANHLRYRGELVAIMLAAATMGGVGFHLMRLNEISPGGASMNSLDAAVLFVGVFALTLYALYFRGILNRIFSLAGLRWVGNISYSYYLIHGLTLHVLAKIAKRILGTQPLSAPAYGMLFLFSLAATIAVAALLFLAIERPFSLSTRAKGERERVPATVQPATSSRAA